MYARRLVPLLLLAALLAGAPALATPPLEVGTRDFDQLHLDLHVTPDLAAGAVDGRATLTFAARTDRFHRLRLHCEETEVLAVLQGETPLTRHHEGGILAIDLPAPLEAGQEGAVTVVYRSTPTRGLYFHRPTERHPSTPWFLYSQGQSNDNRRWIPCYDLPDDRFTWDLHVTVAPDLETVSNGLRTGSETGADGRRTDHWSFRWRSPSYLISLIVAPLETVTDRWRDVVLEYSALPGHGEALRTALGDTPNMMEFFSNWLDAPYPWPRYAQTFVWDFVYGGMENTTATTLNMRALHLPAARPNYMSEPLVAHELAHMWFGDLLTCRTWDGIWLNEGFATYFTDLYFEHRDGDEAFRLRRRGQNGGYRCGTPNAAALNLVPHPRGDRPLELHGGKQYDRGAAILHMLRLELGDEAFREGIRAYVRRHRDQAVTSEDLRRAVEDVVGRDLQWFWDQWVYGAGYPVLEVERHGRTLTVRQVQERRSGQGLFRLTLPVREGPDGPVRRVRVWRERHVVELGGTGGTALGEDYVRVGVGGDLLAEIRLEQPPAAWAAMLARDPDVTARIDAVDALSAFEAGETLRAGLGDRHWAVRKAAAEALGQRDDDPDALAALLATVGVEPDPRVREAVYDALGRRTREGAGTVLATAALEETHDYPRAAAARSLGRVKAGDAFGVLETCLQADSHGDVVRQAAIEGLAALGDPRGATLAEPFCEYAGGRGGTHSLRTAALDCVLKLRPDEPATHDLLCSLLDDPFPGLRRHAAGACGTYRVEAARETLVRLERDDRHGGVKAAAKQALERLDGKE